RARGAPASATPSLVHARSPGRGRTSREARPRRPCRGAAARALQATAATAAPPLEQVKTERGLTVASDRLPDGAAPAWALRSDDPRRTTSRNPSRTSILQQLTPCCPCRLQARRNNRSLPMIRSGDSKEQS